MSKMLNNLTPNDGLYEPVENTEWGFTSFSEKINGRAAMIGFTVLFLFELITKQKIVDFIA